VQPAGQAAGNGTQKAAAIRGADPTAQQVWAAETLSPELRRKTKLTYNYYRWSCGRDQRSIQSGASTSSNSVPWPEQKS